MSSIYLFKIFESYLTLGAFRYGLKELFTLHKLDVKVV